MNSQGIQSYRKTNVVTADPKRLILMCYEGAIDNLKIGKQRLIEQDYEGNGRCLIKTKDIICELKASLDFEKGGAIATGLDSLYNYMLTRILHIEISRDLGAIDEVVGMLEELKSAWEEIFYEKKKGIGSKVAAPEAGENGEILSYSGL